MLVKYVPIDYGVRQGKSKIKARHAFDFFLLVLRTTVYFNPLKIFLPIGAVFFLGGILRLIHDIINNDISDLSVILFTAGALIWGIGLLSDQISKIALKADFD